MKECFVHFNYKYSIISELAVHKENYNLIQTNCILLILSEAEHITLRIEENSGDLQIIVLSAFSKLKIFQVEWNFVEFSCYMFQLAIDQYCFM